MRKLEIYIELLQLLELYNDNTGMNPKSLILRR